jgi:hypothetical protein
MKQTTDPEMLLKLSKEITQLMRKPGEETRGRKPSIKPSSLREKYTGSVYEQMSDGDLVCWHLVFEIEKRQRMGFLKNRAERIAFVAEALASLTEEERAAYEALEREGVA